MHELPQEVSKETVIHELNFVTQANGRLPVIVGLLIRECINVGEVLRVHAYHERKMSLQVILDLVFHER